MLNNVAMAPRRSLPVDPRKMVTLADKKRPFADWGGPPSRDSPAGILFRHTPQSAISSPSRRRML